jgi:hypothetical protein
VGGRVFNSARGVFSSERYFDFYSFLLVLEVRAWRTCMAKVPEYKIFAADCLRWATEAELDEDKELLLEMAQDFALAATAIKLARLPERDRDD